MIPPVRPILPILLVSLTAAGLASAEPTLAGGKGPPVILVTGPEADAGLYVWPGGGGLAPFLARRGLAVWIAEHDDLDAAIGHVVGASGFEEVSLVGHGLGGTAIYRYLAAHREDAPVRAAVVLGAPVGLMPSSPLREAVFAAAAEGVPRWSQLAFRPSPLEPAAQDLFAAAMTATPDEAEVWRRAREAGALTSAPAMADLEAWIGEASALEPVDIPLLIACGEKDRMAPCEEAWRARDLTGGTFHKVGYMNLDGGDQGHLDLVLADRARKRVFPAVARFLELGELP